ncbi:MAG: DUF3299 domain-containing protein [Verrucomicrobiae bacterium]|nr:DUF3299 domain-containing protein [Verrucomicrobiae bacterium]
MNRHHLPAIALGLLTFAAVPAQTPPRGEPIKPLAPKGEPIKPLAPATKPSADAPAAPTVPATPAATSEGVTSVGFETLSAFKYDVPDDTPNPDTTADPDAQIPETVKAFHGKRISLKGFMLPLKVEQGLVTELLIMRDQSMCCYGTVPKINEWVSVRMTSKGVKPVMDQAITLQGTLKVGAIRENGYLVGIYQMDGEKMDGPVGYP